MKATANIGAVCLIAGAVLGAFLGTWYERRGRDERVAAAIEEEAARAGRFEVEVSRLQVRMELIEMHLRLGRIAMEADRQDYGTAGKRATHFFDEVVRMVQETNLADDERAALEHLLAARDELIAGLATAQPEVAESLKQLYLGLFDIGATSDGDDHGA